MKKLFKRFLLLSLVVFVLVLAFDFLGLFSFLEYKSYDNRMFVTAPSFSADEDIAVVIIDQDSLDWAKENLGWSWPWPRSSYGDIVRYFNKGQASCVAFDMMYTEPSLYGQKDDEDFALANKEFGKTALAVHFITDEENTKAVFPIPELKESAGLLASVVSVFDSDKVARRNRYGFIYQDTLYPQLGAASLYLSGDLTADDLREKIENNKTVNLRYARSLNNYIPYSAKQILMSYYAIKKGHVLDEDMIEPENFKDMSVFVGVYAPGLYDICSTPVSQSYPGMGVHVSLLDTLKNTNEIKPLPLYANVLLIFFMSLLGAASILILSFAKKSSSAFLVTALTFVVPLVLYTGFCYALFAHNVWAAYVGPSAAFLLAFISSMTVGYFAEGRQKKYIKTAFSQYLSPVVIDNLVADPSKLKLGGERKEITCYFSDVQGFTSISEGLDPTTLTAFLNEYTSEMSDVIMKSGGTIDKYEGDAIIAFWNAPVDLSDHGRRALEAAVECQKRLEQLQGKLMMLSHKPIKQRIGINTGYAVVGNMGSRMRFNYTMLGDSVNLAARLEGQNKAFGTYTMCSDESRKAAIEHGCTLKFRELARLQVVGKKEAVTVFEPMTEEDYEKRKSVLEIFAGALNLFYRGNLEEAEKVFASIADEDSAALSYKTKCQELLKVGLPAEWDGRWVASSK